jgi:Uncharacterised protein family (UPF0183)
LHFLNYLQLGIDFGFCKESHLLSKIILRTNQIADPIFGFYDRCNFSLDFGEESKDNLVDLTLNPDTKFSALKPLLESDLFYENNLHRECLFSNRTNFYAWPGLIVEVIPETDQIASITLCV